MLYVIWMGVVASLPQVIKNMAKINIHKDKVYFETRILMPQNTFTSIEKCKQRNIKDVIRNKKYSALSENDFKARIKYLTVFNDIDISIWENIFVLPIVLKCSNKIKETQFKILHRIIGNNLFLFKIKKVESPKCSFCEIYDETFSFC